MPAVTIPANFTPLAFRVMQVHVRPVMEWFDIQIYQEHCRHNNELKGIRESFSHINLTHDEEARCRCIHLLSVAKDVHDMKVASIKGSTSRMLRAIKDNLLMTLCVEPFKEKEKEVNP